MIEHNNYQLRAGKTEHFNGYRFRSREKNPRRSNKKPGDTAYHEAEHAVIDLSNVKIASIATDGDSAGRVIPIRMDAVMALGPKSRGRKGTSWDEFVASKMGVNLTIAESVAASILSRKEDEIEEVAYALEEKITLSGKELQGVVHKMHEGVEHEIEMESPDGSIQTFTTKAPRKAEIIQFQLPQNAEIFNAPLAA